ncbi:osmoprotectant transport system ATP-binding protein [Rhodoligotrophos appendicifer]|uniref:ABC transporter ATP-binding protein n=1 Tax=Rhodoligotrophos appendicifer TaxID=987056 RepID=UPI0011868F94|nr:ATP-binding cassette domain-containing protein [Rhodoligotrophos appendicifer]
MPDALRLDAVSKAYGATPVVRSASFTVAQGEFCAIVGPSGCGKTTTLKMINRIIEPSSGRVLIDDEDAAAMDPVLLRRRIGYVIQQVGLFPHMSVEANAGAVLRIMGRPREECRARARAMLDLVGLPASVYADRRPSALSGGQQQRVGVARALAADPDIILMDEPFAAVDPVIRKQLQDEMRRIQRETGKTIVFVTHDLLEAFSLADRIVLLKDGVVIQAGSPEELLFAPSSPFVSEYLAESRELLGLRFMKARDFAMPGSALAPELPADVSVLDVVLALAGRQEVDRLSPVIMGDADGPCWTLDAAGLVRAVVGAVADPAEGA